MKDIVGYENLYAVTEEGQVWGYKRKHYLKPNKDKDGYYYVTLSKNGIQKSYRVHRIVANTYLPNPNNLSEVHHKDADRTNNRVDNLEWISQEENLIEMYIRQLKRLGVSLDEICRRYQDA